MGHRCHLTTLIIQTTGNMVEVVKQTFNWLIEGVGNNVSGVILIGRSSVAPHENVHNKLHF